MVAYSLILIVAFLAYYAHLHSFLPDTGHDELDNT